MNAFEIGCLIYAVIGVVFAFWGIRTAKKRAGSLMTDFLTNRKEIARRLSAGATSPWDPFGNTGAKRWRMLSFVAFGVLMFLLFSGF